MPVSVAHGCDSAGVRGAGAGEGGLNGGMADIEVDPTVSEAANGGDRGRRPGMRAGPDRVAGPLDEVQTAELTRTLDGPWEQVRHRMRALLPTTSFGPVRERLSVAAHRDRTLRILRELAAARLADPQDLPTGLPSAIGGDDDVGGSITVVQMLGHADLSVMVKAGVQWGLFAGSIAALGNAEHHRRYLPAAIDLSLLGCFAMTETGHGSDVESLGTTATYDPEHDELVVHTPTPSDRKDYIGNAALHAQLAVVFARLIVADVDHGVHAVLVPVRDAAGEPAPGVSLSDDGPKGGLNGVDNGRITFDQVRVPRANLLNRYGDISAEGDYVSPIENPKRRFFTMLATLVRGRASVAAAAGAATESALTIAVRYALQRRQFSDGDGEVLLLDYQAHQLRLLPAVATSYALRFAQNRLTRDLDARIRGADALHGEDADRRQRQLETRAAGLKAMTTDHANQATLTCRTACGGAGFLAENLLVQLRADVDVFATFEGDNTVLTQLVGKGLISNYSTHVGELDTLGTVRLVAERVVEVMIERTAAKSFIDRLLGAARREGPTAIDDRAWHLELFEFRERHLLETVAQRMRGRIRAGSDPGAAFVACQDHLLLAARAHVHRVVLEAFLEAVDGCGDAEVAALLDAVCDLYVLEEIKRDRAWFIEHGRMSVPRSKAVVAAVEDLCRTLRPHAATLVDAFAIPDGLVDAAMLT